MALKSCGYGPEHPVIKKGMEGLAPFLIEDRNTLWMQPATSPVWDTAWAVLSLLESGVPAAHPAMAKAGDWIIREEIHSDGDWKIKNSRTPAGCWSFEFHNDLYPDIDDTAVIARALLSLSVNPEKNADKTIAAKRGLNWVKEMQSKDGGWAAFDRDNNKQFLGEVPFADFMTPLDPTSADVTAHVVELFGKAAPGSPELKRAVTYFKNSQESDGSWYGRWGVNYIYGTGLSLVSLESAGEDKSQDYIRRAVKWLESHQLADGGWGETCKTYDSPSERGKGPSTASQTAWALMGLIAAGESSNPTVSRGLEYLLHNQNADGSWNEDAFTGTGSPVPFI